VLLDNLDELKNGWKNCYKTGAKEKMMMMMSTKKEREIIA
jgi:hypothetical protein